MMRARLGIDKTKSWADWAEEEEEAAEPTKTLADAKSEFPVPGALSYIDLHCVTLTYIRQAHARAPTCPRGAR